MSFHKLLEIREHSGPVYTIAYGHGFVYSGSGDKYVTRWNIETGIQDAFAIKFEQSIYSLEIVNDLLFVGLNDGALHIFNVETRKELKHYTQHQKAIFSIRYSPAVNHVYVGDADGNFSVWNASSLQQIIYLPLDCGKIRDIAVNEDGTNFVLACQDSTLRVFDASNFNEIETLEAHEGGATAAHFIRQDSNLMLSGGKDARLKLWNVSTRELLKNIPAHNFAVYRLVELEDGSFLSISRDKTIKVWDNELNVVKRLDAREGGHSHSVNDLVLIDRNRFVTCSDDRRIIIWEKD